MTSVGLTALVNYAREASCTHFYSVAPRAEQPPTQSSPLLLRAAHSCSEQPTPAQSSPLLLRAAHSCSEQPTPAQSSPLLLRAAHSCSEQPTHAQSSPLVLRAAQPTHAQSSPLMLSFMCLHCAMMPLLCYLLVVPLNSLDVSTPFP